MGKVVLKILISIILLTAILGGLELVARTAPNSYAYKDRFILDNGDSVNMLILGNSHSFYGINPNFLGDNSFNLANVSQDLKFDLFLLNRYIDKCPNLNTVIIPICYFTLYNAPLDCGEERFRVKFYERYMGYDDTLLNSFEKLEICSVNTFIKKVAVCFASLCGRDVDYGFDSNGCATDYDAVKTVDIDNSLGDEYVNENVGCLRLIADLCKERNVRLFFVTTPTLPVYYNMLDNKKWNSTTSIINDVCLEYDASYLSYLSDERFDETDFFDDEHLSPNGAEKFSKILFHEILK